MSGSRLAPLLAAWIALAGCSLDTSATLPPGLGDGGDDGGGGDASLPDSGRRDSGAVDSGRRDSGRADSGASDSGLADTGTPDTGTPDTGVADSGAPDTGGPATCADLFTGMVPGYRHCGGVPTAQCDFSFSHGVSFDTDDCNQFCGRGGLTCAAARARDYLDGECGHYSSDIGCGTNRNSAFCECVP